MKIQAHTQTPDACIKMMRSSKQGLSHQEAQLRLQHYGANHLPEEKAPALWLILVRQFMSPLIYILLFAGIITLLMREYPGAFFIFAVLVVNAIIGTVQEYSANRAAASLKKMTATRSRAVREGKIVDIDSTQLVPGDIVLLASGNKVPADLRLIDTASLKVDESLLTGESKDVVKNAATAVDQDAGTSECINMAFAGTLVSSGRATGLVVATGAETQMGKIAKQISEKPRVKSPLIIRMQRFTMRISIMVSVLVIVIASVMFIQGESAEQIFLISVGLAVAAIPEGLPVTLTIALAIGMRRMAKRNVIVRKLVAVESLGSCTLIASDKTGTLTRNELTAERLVLPTGEVFTITSADTANDTAVSE